MYTDRYYSSLPLAEALLQHNTKFTGTVIKNRVGLPDVIRSRAFSLQSDETRAFRDGSLLTVAWRAATKRKPLIMLTSSWPHEMVTVSSRRTTQTKPLVVDRYNQSMNGFDRADQYTVYYSFVRRSVKWWRKVFLWVMEVAVVNSYILHKCTSQTTLTHLEYRRSLVRTLAAAYVQSAPPRGPGRRKRPHQPQHGDPERLNRQPHFLEKGTQRDCTVCISTRDTGTGPHTTAKPARHTLHFVLPPVLRGTTPWRTTGDHLQRSSNSCSLFPSLPLSLSLPLSHSPSLSLCTSPLAREGVSVYPVKTKKQHKTKQNNTIYPLTLRNPSCGKCTHLWMDHYHEIYTYVH